MSYYCPNHFITHVRGQFIHNEQIDPSLNYAIQRNGTRINIVNSRYSKISMNNSQHPPSPLKHHQNKNLNQSYISSTIHYRQETLDEFTTNNTIQNVRRTKSRINKINQRLFIVRHGERVDTTFGALWLQNSFKNGDYIRFNLNMPKTMPYRGDVNEFAFDPPLTEIGMFQAKLHGEELTRRCVKISHVYSSPALRSIQTADKILEGMGLKKSLPIRIEAGLFELLSWQNFIPKNYPFMNTSSLVKAGYNIETSYMSVLPYYTLNPSETEEDFYKRSHYLTKTIVNRHALDGGNIMFIGHAPTIGE